MKTIKRNIAFLIQLSFTVTHSLSSPTPPQEATEQDFDNIVRDMMANKVSNRCFLVLMSHIPADNCLHRRSSNFFGSPYFHNCFSSPGSWILWKQAIAPSRSIGMMKLGQLRTNDGLRHLLKNCPRQKEKCCSKCARLTLHYTPTMCPNYPNFNPETTGIPRIIDFPVSPSQEFLSMILQRAPNMLAEHIDTDEKRNAMKLRLKNIVRQEQAHWKLHIESDCQS